MNATLLLVFFGSAYLKMTKLANIKDINVRKATDIFTLQLQKDF